MAAPARRGPVEKEEEKEKQAVALDERDIQLLSRYVSASGQYLLAGPFLYQKTHRVQGVGPYTNAIKALETGIVEEMKKVNELIGAWRDLWPDGFMLS